MQILYTLQNGDFGSKYKIFKNMRSATLEPRKSCAVQKTSPKKTLLFEKSQHFQKGQSWPPWRGYSF